MRWVNRLFHRRLLERELDAELRFHWEQQVAGYQSQGLTRQESERLVRLSFGDLEQVKDDCRDARGLNVVENLVADTTGAVRGFLRAPGFSITALLMLALGIGGTTAMFSVLYAVLLKPLPVPDADRVVVISGTTFVNGRPVPAIAYGTYLDITGLTTSFEAIGIMNRGSSTGSYTTVTPAGPVLLRSRDVTSGFLPALGIAPLYGRNFRTEDEEPGNTDKVLLTHSFWNRSFAGNPAVVGRTMKLNNREFDIVGILPAEFDLLERDLDVVAPIPANPAWKTSRNWWQFSCHGRLKTGVTLDSARTELALIGKQLEKAYPEVYKDRTLKAELLSDFRVRNSRTLVLVLMAAVACVMLIACANVANLFLVRAADRRRQIAIRIALGCSRARLAQQLLTECMVLFFLGGVSGFVLARLLLQTTIKLALESFPLIANKITLDMSMFAFSIAVSLLVAVLFGFAPALETCRVDLAETMKESAQRLAGGIRRKRMQRLLVGVQLSLVFALLVCGGLLVRTMWRLEDVPLGFDPERVLTIFARLRPTASADGRVALYTRLLESVSAIPSVRSAAVVTQLPLVNRYFAEFLLDFGAPPEPGREPNCLETSVSPQYFRTLGTPILRGRVFTDADTAHSTPVIIINQTFVSRFFPGMNAVGHHIRWLHEKNWREIVGVVSDVRNIAINQPVDPTAYVPVAQYPRDWLHVVVRTSERDRSATAEALRRAVQSVDSEQAWNDVKEMTDIVSNTLRPTRLRALVLLAFAVVGILLAAVGVYGIIAYSVTTRTHEIGVRMALGARARTILLLIGREAAGLTVMALVSGLALALIASKGMSSLLYEVPATDVTTYTAAALFLFSTAALATLIPAHIATRVHPMTALRHE